MMHVYENYLVHYGVLGQKWGVRRYQPYSVRGRISGKGGKMVGKAAEANKNHRDMAETSFDAYERRKNNKKIAEKAFTPSIKSGKDKPPQSPAEQSFKELNKISDEAVKINRVVQKKKNASKPRESKQLSDAELRKRIDRLNLEKQYDKLKDDELEQGKITANDVLATIGAVAAIGASLSVIIKNVHDVTHSDMDLNYLSHHGIKGQKWGERNGPPYPLKPSDHSAAEKKASSGRSGGSGESFANKLLNKYGKKDMVGMDPVTTMYLAEAAAWVAIIASIRIAQEVTYSKDKKEHMNSDVGDIKKKIKGKHTEDQDMAEVNKGYSDPDNLGTHMNCALCSATYDLRRRGYDVKARETKQGRKSKDIAAYYGIDKKEIKKLNSYNKLVDSLRNEPDGARGFTMTGAGMFDSLHCMVWEKNDGRVIIRDCQSNTKYDSLSESCINKYSRYTYEYIRTDNREVNWDVIKDAVEERKD